MGLNTALNNSTTEVLRVWYLDAGAPVTVRLAGGSERTGRLEVYYRDVWGTVCDDFFTDIAAKVACNSLGFGFVTDDLLYVQISIVVL